VFTEEGLFVGKISSLMPVPQGHILQIEKANGKQVLVPFRINEFVIDITDR
jgi:16S rRNA processing protein RimM